MKTAPNYLNPEIPSGLKRVTIPIVEATAESLAGYGHIVSDSDEVEIEIVRWPAQGHRAHSGIPQMYRMLPLPECLLCHSRPTG